MEDEKIIALLEARSQDGITEAKRKYDPLCRSLAGKLLRNEEDVEEWPYRYIPGPVERHTARQA